MGEGIIMARRVTWLGHRPKTLSNINDCVVANFKYKHLAARALLILNEYPEVQGGIQVRPLGYFYPQHILEVMKWWVCIPMGGLLTARLEIRPPCGPLIII